MTEYAIQILNDEGFHLFVVLFSGLYLTFYLVGFLIQLVICILYKITHLHG